jgi:anti-sigma B factor antagonist
MPLSLSADELSPELVLISVDGTVDAATAPDLRAVIEPFSTRTGVIVVLDLGTLEFIDSAGLGALIGAQRRLREAEGELRLTRVPSHVQKLLRITALDQALPIHAPQDDDGDE